MHSKALFFNYPPKQGSTRTDDNGLGEATLPALGEAYDDGDEGAEVGADVEARAQSAKVVLPRVRVHEVEPRHALARDHLQQQH